MGPQGSLQIFAIYFDPSSQSLQKSHIEAIDKVIDNRFHVILAGDFNFVEHQTDRFVKQAESSSLGADKTVNTRWQSFLSRHAIKEWAQPHFTCETGIVLSRIDRIYSNLHLAHRLLDVSYAVVLDRDPSISCHRPLSFGIRSGKAARPNVFPDWIVQHPEFLKEVEAEYRYCLGDGATSGFERLAILKTALVESAKLLRKIATHERPTSTGDRIGLCVAFLRAVQLGSFRLAGSLQRKYPEELGDVDLTTNFWHSQAFARVQDHLLELVQTSTQARIKELRLIKDSLPENLYSQRKSSILRTLKKLIPGGSGQLHALRDDLTGQVTTDPQTIGKMLTKYWQNVFEEKATNATLRKDWLENLRARLSITVDDLRPTREDVDFVLSHLPHSAPGPDGIPFAALRSIKHLLAPILWDVVQGMISGT